MGKKYYCEYCDKRFRDDPNIRRKHIEGLPHQKARNEHYAQYKSPQEILQDEQKKRPCAKFPLGICQFGATCRFSHYNPEQLAKLQQQVNFEKQQQIESQKPKQYSRKLITDFMKRRKLAKEQKEREFLRELFDYPEELLKRENELPPSLKPLDPELLRKPFKIHFFG